MGDCVLADERLNGSDSTVEKNERMVLSENALMSRSGWEAMLLDE
jgi:hypothetical protein